MTSKETLAVVAAAIAIAEAKAQESPEALNAIEKTAQRIANGIKSQSPRFNKEGWLFEALPIGSERVKQAILASLALDR